MSEPEIKAKLLEAAKNHVPFDGWSDISFRAAIEETSIAPGLAEAVCPRGAVDLALAYHEAGDRAMIAAIEATDLTEMKFRDRIAFALRARLEAADDKELVRRGMTLFALPNHAADGAQAIWRTCDRIWRALGDGSEDINWYTKRMTLSAVYGASVLYWLGDDSSGHSATREFIDRRIADVMQIEKVKAQLRQNSLVSGLMAGPLAMLGRIKPPRTGQHTGMPGRWNGPQQGAVE